MVKNYLLSRDVVAKTESAHPEPIGFVSSRNLLQFLDGVPSAAVKDHPELKGGTQAWVKKLRRESEARFRKQFRKR